MKYNLSVFLTPNQNIILCDIHYAWKKHVNISLSQADLLHPHYVDPLNITPMEFLALPLCPLAIIEDEIC